MKGKINISIGVIISILFLLIFNISSFALQCTEIRRDVIRLHVIANSDSKSDQELKLEVRDAVLTAGADIFDGSITIDNAKEKILPKIEYLKATAANCIQENGYNYDVDVSFCTEYFDTRTYDDSITFPAGKYNALKIVIGEGKGQNWWCVMYPSLCLPAASEKATVGAVDYFSKDENDVLLNNNKYKVRLKIVEYIEKIKNNVDKAID